VVQTKTLRVLLKFEIPGTTSKGGGAAAKVRLTTVRVVSKTRPDQPRKTGEKKGKGPGGGGVLLRARSGGGGMVTYPRD